MMLRRSGLVRAVMLIAILSTVARADEAPATAATTAPTPPASPAAFVPPALVHHSVSTTIPKAQQAFDEGLTLVYAFNRDEARSRFERAAALDPKLAIAWWGVALAVGPNINFGIDADRLASARAALVRARALEDLASPEERALIEALALRYPPDAKAATGPGYRAYRDAMRAVHATYPADDDAATLYAESVMDVDGWSWTKSVPNASGREIRRTLETVLARDSGHIGANHYYLHLVDAVGVAKLGLPSADRLSALTVEPAASHLMHMPGHIYLDVGRFADLERDNRIAVDDDRSYATTLGKNPTDLDYYRHNLNFYMGGAVMLDDRLEEDRAVGFSREIGGSDAKLAALRDGRFTDVLATPLPAASASTYTIAIARYARSIALASRGDADGAQRELDAYEAAVRSHARRGSDFAYYFDALRDLMKARIAHARGDDDAATALLRGVLVSTDPYPPETFPVWYFPVGEWLGWMELHRGKPAAAEAAFRDDLARTPRNARAIFGLMASLSHQGRTTDAGPLAYEIVGNWRGPLGDLRVALP